MIKAIAFDWGGIFTENTFDSSAVRNLATLCSTTPETIGNTYFPLMEHFEAGEFSFESYYRQFVAKSGFAIDAGIFRKTFLGSVRERAGMFDVLNAIPETYKVGMLSNNVEVLCDRVRDDARFGRIDSFVFSNEIKVRKPDPRAFEALLEALGTRAEETVFIDDNADNIKACETMGFKALYLDTFENFWGRWKTLLPEISLPVRS
ncbi:MAG: HAD family hydrolase [Trueperaceae bacterium]